MHIEMRQVAFLLLCPWYEKKQFNRNKQQFNRKQEPATANLECDFFSCAWPFLTCFHSLRRQIIEMRKIGTYSGTESSFYSFATLPLWASTTGFRESQHGHLVGSISSTLRLILVLKPGLIFKIWSTMLNTLMSFCSLCSLQQFCCHLQSCQQGVYAFSRSLIKTSVIWKPLKPLNNPLEESRNMLM